MKIRVLISCAGLDFSYPPGIHDAPEALARDLVGGGLAEFVEESAETKAGPVAETSDIGEAESAESSDSRRRHKK